MKRVMLAPGRKLPFHRTVRDGKGKPLRTLRFVERVPVELSGADLAAVQKDIGGALIVEEPRRKREAAPLVSEIRDPVPEQPTEVGVGQHVTR